MFETFEQIVLILEPAIDGGSVALFQKGCQIAVAAGGAAAVSKSDDLINIIGDLLEKNNLKKSSIATVVVSREPGSLTGMRNGLAAAQGLADALGLRVISVSLLECLLWQNAGLQNGKYLAAFETAGSGIYFCLLTVEGNKIDVRSESRRVLEINHFLEEAGSNLFKTDALYLNTKLIENLKVFKDFDKICQTANLIEVEGNPATIIGRATTNKKQH